MGLFSDLLRTGNLILLFISKIFMSTTFHGYSWNTFFFLNSSVILLQAQFLGSSLKCGGGYQHLVYFGNFSAIVSESVQFHSVLNFMTFN